MALDSVEKVRVRELPDGRMTREDAARYLGFTSKTLANLQMKGEGPRRVKIRGRVFYYRADLDDFLRSETAA